MTRAGCEYYIFNFIQMLFSYKYLKYEVDTVIMALLGFMKLFENAVADTK